MILTIEIPDSDYIEYQEAFAVNFEYDRDGGEMSKEEFMIAQLLGFMERTHKKYKIEAVEKQYTNETEQAILDSKERIKNIKITID